MSNANSIPGVSRIPDRMIRWEPPPAPPPRGTITLRTKDGHIVKRYLDNMAEDVKPEKPPLMEFYCHTPSEAEERQTLLCLEEKMRGADLVEKYRSNHRKTWEDADARGFTSMPVLPQFWGKKLDNSLIAYLHTLRPSSVRISEGCVTCDSSPWRVTVITKLVDGVEMVENIRQEVCIGFGSGYAVAAVFKHIHEGGKKPEPFPRVVGNLSALAKMEF